MKKKLTMIREYRRMCLVRAEGNINPIMQEIEATIKKYESYLPSESNTDDFLLSVALDDNFVVDTITAKYADYGDENIKQMLIESCLSKVPEGMLDEFDFVREPLKTINEDGIRLALSKGDIARNTEGEWMMTNEKRSRLMRDYDIEHELDESESFAYNELMEMLPRMRKLYEMGMPAYKAAEAYAAKHYTEKGIEYRNLADLPKFIVEQRFNPSAL